MTKCVAKQILENWLEIFFTYLEIYALDVKVQMEVDLNEQKHSCTMPFKGSKEKQLIDLSECWTLMLEYLIIRKTMTSNVKTVLWKYFVALCEHVGNNFIVNELDYGLEKFAAGKEHSKLPINMTLILETSERQRQLMTN